MWCSKCDLPQGKCKCDVPSPAFEPVNCWWCGSRAFECGSLEDFQNCPESERRCGAKKESPVATPEK